jgi:hypothetical protein
MKSRVIVFLQKAVYYLSPYVFLVRSEEFALEHTEYAFHNAEIGLEVFGYSWSTLVTTDVGGAYICNS